MRPRIKAKNKLGYTAAEIKDSLIAEIGSASKDKPTIKIRKAIDTHTSAIAEVGETITDVKSQRIIPPDPTLIPRTKRHGRIRPGMLTVAQRPEQQNTQTLLGTGNAISDKICPHRHVKLRMTLRERLRYVPPRGINVLFYGPSQGELALPSDEVNATFYCPVLNPNRDEQRYLHDIDEELANLKVIQDNIKEWHEPHLVKEPRVLMHVLIEKLHDHPDLDKHIKNIRDVTTTEVTESAITEINTKNEKMEQYEKLKKNLLKETERKTADGDKINEGSIGVL